MAEGVHRSIWIGQRASQVGIEVTSQDSPSVTLHVERSTTPGLFSKNPTKRREKRYENLKKAIEKLGLEEKDVQDIMNVFGTKTDGTKTHQKPKLSYQTFKKKQKIAEKALNDALKLRQNKKTQTPAPITEENILDLYDEHKNKLSQSTTHHTALELLLSKHSFKDKNDRDTFLRFETEEGKDKEISADLLVYHTKKMGIFDAVKEVIKTDYRETLTPQFLIEQFATQLYQKYYAIKIKSNATEEEQNFLIFFKNFFSLNGKIADRGKFIAQKIYDLSFVFAKDYFQTYPFTGKSENDKRILSGFAAGMQDFSTSFETVWDTAKPASWYTPLQNIATTIKT